MTPVRFMRSSSIQFRLIYIATNHNSRLKDPYCKVKNLQTLPGRRRQQSQQELCSEGKEKPLPFNMKTPPAEPGTGRGSQMLLLLGDEGSDRRETGQNTDLCLI